jgi:hypothetical protein
VGETAHEAALFYQKLADHEAHVEAKQLVVADEQDGALGVRVDVA